MAHSTLSDISANAEGILSVYADDSTPEGHFQATTAILGITSTYLLEGVEGDLNAKIVGRIELPEMSEIGKKRPNAYKGSSLKGGEFILFSDFAQVFARMI